jgi:hypothetical protein
MNSVEWKIYHQATKTLGVLGADGGLVVKPMNPGLEAPYAGKDAGVTVLGPANPGRSCAGSGGRFP